MRLLVATTNRHKVEEIRRLLAGLPIELITLDGWPGLPAPAETGQTFEASARQKAEYYARATGELTVAEDSGIEIDALGGIPGVQSARYGGEETSYPEKFARVYAALDQQGSRDSPARFVCALVLATPEAIRFTARGVVEGRVAREPAGMNGFGYDPLFFYPPFGCTFGEVPSERKMQVSHRARAAAGLFQFLVGNPA